MWWTMAVKTHTMIVAVVIMYVLKQSTYVHTVRISRNKIVCLKKNLVSVAEDQFVSVVLVTADL